MSQVPSIQIFTERKLTITMNTEFHTPFEWFINADFLGYTKLGWKL